MSPSPNIPVNGEKSENDTGNPSEHEQVASSLIVNMNAYPLIPAGTLPRQDGRPIADRTRRSGVFGDIRASGLLFHERTTIEGAIPGS